MNECKLLNIKNLVFKIINDLSGNNLRPAESLNYDCIVKRGEA